jgi:hypothetical protein
MGQSTNGMLVYGYNLGGGDGPWEVEGVDEYGEWSPSWLNPDPDNEDGGGDVIEDAKKVLLASVGFTETDWRADGYFDRQRDAEARLGVEFDSYCSGDYPMWLLAAHVITVYRGDVQEVNFAALEQARTEGDWDTKLAHAIQALGVTPKQERPKWLLVSYWG